jgi:hypothetical protein
MVANDAVYEAAEALRSATDVARGIVKSSRVSGLTVAAARSTDSRASRRKTLVTIL